MRRRTNSMSWISFRKPWQHLRVQLCIGIIKRNFSSTYLDTWGRTANLKDQGVSLYGSLTIIFHYFVSPFLRMTESFSVYYFSFHMFLLTFLWFHFNFRQKCTFNVFIKLFESYHLHYGCTFSDVGEQPLYRTGWSCYCYYEIVFVCCCFKFNYFFCFY